MDEPLYDISQVHPRIILDIKYATADNFLGKPLYKIAKAYLRKSVALKLGRVQQELEKKGLGLKSLGCLSAASCTAAFVGYCS